MNVQINFIDYDESDKLAMFYSKNVPDFIKFNKNDYIGFGSICELFNFSGGDLQCKPELPECYVDLKTDYIPMYCVIKNIYHESTIDGEYLLVLDVIET